LDGALVEGFAYDRAHVSQKRRDRAERQRLTYVASTRASHAMIFVGDRKVPTKGETESYASSTAAALRSIAEDAATCARAMLHVEDASGSLPEPAGQLFAIPSPAPAAVLRAPQAPPSWRALPIATTALQDFHH